MGIYEKVLNDAKYTKWGIPEKECWLKPNSMSPGRYDSVAWLIKKYNLGGKVLDVGCGQGVLLVGLSKWFEKLYGVDISDTAIKHAKIYASKYIAQYAKYSFIKVEPNGKLPFSDKMFDVVLCIAALEHIHDIFSALKEYKRVLKTNGILILEIPNLGYIKHRIRLLFGLLPITAAAEFNVQKWAETGWDGNHCHYFTKTTTGCLLNHSGFIPLLWTGSGKFAKLRRWYPALLCADLIVLSRKKGMNLIKEK